MKWGVASIVAILAFIFVSSAWLVGCGGHDPAVEDLDPNGITQERGERLVYVMPDTFPNVIAMCDGGTRVYITNRDYQQLVAIPDSKECQG